jgi:molybdopterin molybdotransferase
MLTYDEARRTVIAQVSSRPRPGSAERVPLAGALGRILAEQLVSDRAYPPFDRSTRDGYAVKASEAAPGANLRCVGEIKAGDQVRSPLAAGTCVQIMTGAAVPPEADAVVMIEFTERSGDQIRFTRETRAGQNIVAHGTEAAADQILLFPGTRLGFAELAIAAQVGASELACSARPRVAILSTGDEVVGVGDAPGPFEIRNSNSVSLAAQTRLSGGDPVPLGNAPDRKELLQAKIREGLAADILVLSGGVSMGKYDLVEDVLKDLGAEFYFDAVAIRPGKPAVFGCCGQTLVFGLPGNPVSTMVTFELLVTAAIDLLGGAPARPLPLLEARLVEALEEKPGLTHFLPARLEWKGTEPWVRALHWHGSGDIATLARANCFIVLPAEAQRIAASSHVRIFPRRDVL